MKHSTSVTLPTVGLLLINNNKLLLAFSKNKNAWYLPGGKIDFGETPMQSLIREIREELNITLEPSLITYYCHIQVPAFKEEGNIIMEQDCYLYKLDQEITPNNEIEAVKYFDLKTYLKEPEQVVGVLKVFNKLNNDKLLFNSQ
ncbi:NUDIX hydrolase [Flavobacterium sp. HTF]|uniref:NUDIX hydrolase n=1 Tax=Flavobacterium sp. HTF TaxID=2170732 RepID=UPI000D5D69E4|nr:NUDIX domain-containing protein [Flavobacterium sp. HTF]PWB27213.1 DNA mismatch repair protein MutT [Flavobacterium sp. HTF]